MSARKRLLLKVLKLAPAPIVWRFARTYIAGQTLDHAAATMRELSEAGCRSTLDVLGEDISERSEVDGYVSQYLAALERIEQEHLPANISVKPTALGLKLAPEIAREAFATLCGAAAKRGNFVRIDMEDSSVTQATLDLYRWLRGEGHENVGVVLQAYLRRTLSDAAWAATEGVSVRLCKGIYVEPRSLAYQQFDTVREAYVAALDRLLQGRGRVGIATHDEWLVLRALHLLERYQVPPERYEFQMLLGVDPELRRCLTRAGHPLRVYVPFGQGWRAYSLRRLVENPRLAGHVAKNVLGFGVGRQAAP